VTFEGELSQLRFYKKTLNLMEIRNNLYIDANRYCIRETYGGSLIVQPTLASCGNLSTYLLCGEDCFFITENGDLIKL